MEFWIVVAVLIFGGYQLFSANTKRGVETVRAHVFLASLAGGQSVADANRVASYDVASGPTEMIQSAMAHLHAQYGGRQAAMIGDAYQKGMSARLPNWYRSVVLKA